MAKWVCSVCGYVHEGDTPPERCPICKVPASKFNKMEEGEMVWASEHVVGVAKGAPEDIIQGLRENFEGECSDRAALEEAEHAAKFAELLGEVLTDSTKENLRVRVDAEYGATAGKTELAKKAKALNLDAIHDTVHEMARDEARHGKAFKGLLERYFK